MNWSNIDLDSDYERDLNIIDPYNFDTLLLEIQCNVRDINIQTVEKQFLTALQSRVDSAKEVFYANCENITKRSLDRRNSE